MFSHVYSMNKDISKPSKNRMKEYALGRSVRETITIKSHRLGSSLLVQWLRPHAPKPGD